VCLAIHVVIGAVRAMLSDQTKLLDTLKLADLAPDQIAAALASTHEIAQRLAASTRHEDRELVRVLVSRVTIAEISIAIQVSIKGLRATLGLPIASGELDPSRLNSPCASPSVASNRKSL
jgi:hypothetical protein